MFQIALFINEPSCPRLRPSYFCSGSSSTFDTSIFSLSEIFIERVFSALWFIVPPSAISHYMIFCFLQAKIKRQAAERTFEIFRYMDFSKSESEPFHVCCASHGEYKVCITNCSLRTVHAVMCVVHFLRPRSDNAARYIPVLAAPYSSSSSPASFLFPFPWLLLLGFFSSLFLIPMVSLFCNSRSLYSSLDGEASSFGPHGLFFSLNDFFAE